CPSSRNHGRTSNISAHDDAANNVADVQHFDAGEGAAHCAIEDAGNLLYSFNENLRTRSYATESLDRSSVGADKLSAEGEMRGVIFATKVGVQGALKKLSPTLSLVWHNEVSVGDIFVGYFGLADGSEKLWVRDIEAHSPTQHEHL